MQKIDTHQHLLYPDHLSYPWVDTIPPLQGAFHLEDYKEVSEGCGIAGTVFMEVDVPPVQMAREVKWVEELASGEGSGIVGIVAAARPEADDFETPLDAVSGPLLKGVRRVLHTQPDALSQSSGFRANLRQLPARGLSFDLCVLARQLPLAIELVDACPEVTFILDHCGVPDIAGGAYDSWSESIGRLAERENVVCKISGLPTYCAPGKTGPEILRPWVERVIECFGWDRLLWGGDWPVCTLNSTFNQWVEVVDALLAGERKAHQSAIYSGNARRIYGLE